VKRANFLIRASAGNVPVLASLRRAFRAVDPSPPILYVRSMEEQIAPSTAPNRAATQVAAVFGCAALLLAAIGLYGVLSYSIVRGKTGIADRDGPGRDHRPGRSRTPAGAALTYAALRLIANQLYGIAPQDPLTLTAAIALLWVVAFGRRIYPRAPGVAAGPVQRLRGVE
jgi:putative ABC transport system permease protein